MRAGTPLAEIVIAVHDARRPVGRAIESIVGGPARGETPPVRVTVVCHNLPATAFDETAERFRDADVRWVELLDGVRAYLGPDYDIEKHFTPKYRPWRQRIAFVPEGDLFHGINAGKASVVTDEIDRFVDKGILLKSGKVLEADIIVTATGFDISALGDIDFAIDGKPLDFHDTVTYRGMMFTGIPNLLWIFGYFRASWTLPELCMSS